MKLTEQLTLVADTYRHAKGLSRGRVSTIVFNQGRLLDRIAEGREITTGRSETAMRWFSENWPDDVEWPEDVPRHLYGGANIESPFEMTVGAT